MIEQKGFKTFLIIWFGQLISLLGSGITRFALLIWAYEQTQNATTVALLGFFSLTPYVLASPMAGVWVDRLDRRWVLIGADLGSGLMTIGLLSLMATDSLAIWHLFVASALAGVFEAFQLPAYMAATTMLLPKKQFARASGLRSFGTNFSQIGGPILAGILLAWLDIEGVMLIDIATFLFAVGTLFFVRIPHPEASPDHEADTGNSWQSFRFSVNYIWQRPGLRGLLAIFTGINFFAALTYFGVLPTLVLARTGGDELALASVQSALGAGGVVGGLLLSVWGGPKRQIHSVLGATAVSFWVGDLLLATGQTTLVWMIGAFLASFFVPFIVGGNAAIWQSKVPPALQGRVLSVQQMLQQATLPLGYLLAGPLADWLFEPAMQPDGWLTPIFSWLVGTGAGAGMGVMFLGTAVCGTLVSLFGYLLPAVRNVEQEIPDFDAGEAVAEAA